VARLVSVAELAALYDPGHKVHARLTIQNLPFETLIGVEPLLSFSVNSNGQQSVESATITCDVLKGSQSLSPYLSTGAKFDGKPLLLSGYYIDIEVQITPPGGAPTFLGWRKCFSGLVDRIVVDPTQGTLTMTLRDRMGRLLDRQIENLTLVEGEYQWGFPVAAGDIYTAGRYVIDTAHGYTDLGGAWPEPLEVIGDPAMSISEYWQDRTSWLEALRALMVGRNGFDLRGRWDVNGADSFPLTYYLPGDPLSSAVHHFTRGFTGASIPYDHIAAAVWDKTGVRNVAEVTPADELRVPVVVENEASKAEFGRRFMAAAEDATTHILTPAQASNLADRIVYALGFPPTAVDLVLPFMWHVDLHDRFSLEGDGYTFDYPGPAWSEPDLLMVQSMVKSWQDGSGTITLSGARQPTAVTMVPFEGGLIGAVSPIGLRDFQRLAVSKHQREVYVRTFAPVGPGRPNAEWYWVEDDTLAVPDA
jgi:hypothetical protein